MSDSEHLCNCIRILDRLKDNFREYERMKSSYEQEEMLLNSLENTLGLVPTTQCCQYSAHGILLQLSMISRYIANKNALKRQIVPSSFEATVKTQDLKRDSELMESFLVANLGKTVRFLINSLCHVNRFIRYKASKLFIDYFAQLPAILLGYEDSMKYSLRSCTKNGGNSLVMSILHDALKCFRKQHFAKVSPTVELPEDANVMSQLRILNLIAEIGINVLRDMHTCGSCTVQYYESTVSLKTIYQAKKLKLSLIRRGDENRDTENANLKHGISREISQLFDSLECLVTISPIDLKDIFQESQSDNLTIFYKLKILIIDVTNNTDDSTAQMANDFLACFVAKSENSKQMGFKKFNDFAGKARTNEMQYNHSTPNLRLLILAILKCFLICLEKGYKSCIQAFFDLGTKVCIHLCMLLECSDKTQNNSYADGKFSKQLMDVFAEYLVNALIDEDDQLCMCLKALLQIYNRLSTFSSMSAAENPFCQTFDVKFPHKLFLCLLKEISFDHVVCIDWLISEETCFVEVLHLYLDIIISDFKSFVEVFSDIDCFSRGVLQCYSSHLFEEECNSQFGHSEESCNENSEEKMSKSIAVDAKACFSLVDYSNSDSDSDDSNHDFYHACWRETASDNLHCDSTVENVESVEDYNDFDCELKNYSNDTEDNGSSKQRLSGDFNEVMNICTNRTEVDGDADLHSLGEENNWMSCITLENLMDFLIRLRLKLERVEEHRLSCKSFDVLLSKLCLIEEQYDSLTS